MFERIREKLKDRFARVWLAILAGAVLILIFQALRKPPSLSDVLSGGQQNYLTQLPLYIASMLAFSLLALSLAKGYEIFKRNGAETEVALVQETLPSADTLEIDGLHKELAELKAANQRILSENLARKNEFNEACSQRDKLKFAEQMLRRSNLYLSKECERLKSENEMLALTASTFNVKNKKPSSASKVVKKKARTKKK